MKTTIKRAAAYVIDSMVLVLIASLISNIPFLNPQLEQYNKYYNKLINLTEKYNSFSNDLEKYYEDEQLNESDYQQLIEDYPSYKEVVALYYEDGALDSDEYDSLLEEVTDRYQEEYIKLYYQEEKNATFSYAIYIIVTILYFGLFNKITNGQTLGKKIFRLKIVKKDNSSPNLINYLLRSILIYNTIYYIIAMITTYLLSQNSYYTLVTIVYQIQYYIQLIIMIMVVMREDGRGLHDMLGNTSVVMLDKNGNIIQKTTQNNKEEDHEEATTSKRTKKEIETTKEKEKPQKSNAPKTPNKKTRKKGEANEK